MGADLYIESIHNVWRKEWEPRFHGACRQRDNATSPSERERLQEEVAKVYAEEFEQPVEDVGYLRDSYNDGSVFWYLGHSWWQLAKPGADGFLKGSRRRGIVRGYIQPDVAEAIANGCTIEPGPVIEHLRRLHERDEASRAEWQAGYRRKPFRAPTDLAEWESHFRQGQLRLVQFFRHAARLKEPIRASV
jgi:hypothetical protein